ncbi:MAG TPA: kynureninase [Cyclobacteriaceae bacterium]|nr:kynureninase [Cyclobacteriaceae bacterium]
MFKDQLAFARKLDQTDPLKSFRSQFFLPKINRKSCIYFTGNSLGLQPKTVRSSVLTELNDWARQGVEGHFHAKRPWLYYHKFAKKALAKLAGAKPEEVVAMNQLTVNLHLMLVSFYKPTGGRFKIIAEAGAFSSDQYAFESHIRLHGMHPDAALIEVAPRPGEHTLRTEDITKVIKQNADQLSLVVFGGVQYYTGQFFDIRAITKAAHDAGAYAGFDLAHAIGNVPLSLHDDKVDFAVWCSYKYLNSGPGGIAGAFVHEKHFDDKDLPRLAGWWGYNEADRFKMKKGFKPMHGADAWQLSNFPVLSGAAHLASLEIFDKAPMTKLRRKSLQLTGYAQFVLHQIDPEEKYFSIITPADPDQRGCQLSILMKSEGDDVFKKITKAGVVADWREPDVIRIAPVPLYNTFEEVWRFGQIFRRGLGI